MTNVSLSARYESVAAGATGVVYTISRALGSTSTLALVTGTNGNLTLAGTAITAVAAIAAGVSQTAVVYEETAFEGQKYAVVISGKSSAGTPTPTSTPPPAAPALNTSVSNLKMANTGNIRAAMARVRNGTGGMKIITPGDSTTASGGVASGNSRMNSWPGVMAAQLTSAGQIPARQWNIFGGGGTASDQATFNAYAPDSVISAGWTFAGFSLGGAFATSSTAGSTFKYTPLGSCNRFRVRYTKSAAAGVFSCRIDAGAETQVDRSGADAVGELIVDTALGTRSITFTVVSGTVSILDVEALVVGENYIRVLNVAAGSSQSGNWNEGAAPWSPLTRIAAEAADLAIVDLGINDWRSGDVSSAFTANLQAVITAAKASARDVILMSPMPSASAQVPEARQTAYRNAITALATNNNLPLLDLHAFYVSGDQAITDGWLLNDGIHQTVTGYARTGTLVANTLRYIEQMTSDVAAVNHTPSAGAISNMSSATGSTASGSVASAFTDEDGDALTFAATGLPAGISLSTAGVVSGTITAAAGSSSTVVVTANDGRGGTAQIAFTWAITTAAPAGAFLNDTFVGSNGAQLVAHVPETGGAWSVQSSGNTAAPATIFDNRVHGIAANIAYQNAAVPPSADYAVEAVFYKKSDMDADLAGLCVRMQASAKTFYMARYARAGSTVNWGFGKFVNGTGASIGANVAITDWADGTAKTVKFTVQATTLTLFVDGVQIIQVTDADISAAGKAGVRLGNTTDTTGVHVDSVKATDL